MKDTTWLHSIITAMIELGGKARYEDLYQRIIQVRKKEGLPLNDTYKATVRQVIEAHSSDSDVWKKRPGSDIFRKLGTGFWGLRNPDTHIQSTGNLSLVERIKAEYNSGNYTKFEEEANKLYKEFYDKFSPEKLSQLQGEDLLDTIFLGKDNKSMCYYLEHEPSYREIFGSIKGGTSAKYGLYYSKELEAWITGNWKTKENRMGLNDAIQMGIRIRDALIHACEVIGSLKPFSDPLAYEDLSRKLSELKYLSKNQWIRKYFHMIYPDYFPTFYREELIDNVITLCKLPQANSLYGKLGEIVRFAKKCQISNVVFSKIIYPLFDLKEPEDCEELLRYFVESCLQAQARLQRGDHSNSGLSAIRGNFSDLIEYKTSFGQGSLAVVPWMSFCGFGQKTSKGIYPVVLFNVRSGDTDNMEFCYGLSVKEKPDIAWNEEFVDGLRHSATPNYATSFCKKSYKISSMADFEANKTDMIECLKGIIKDYEMQFTNRPGSKMKETMTIDQQNIKNPLNTILYGAPGTGKTYSTIIKAMEIIDDTKYDNIDEAKYKELHARFKELKNQGQVEFITFHQSMSYEEFVEGIKPVLQDESDTEHADLRYKIESGIFKSIANRASKKTSLQKVNNIDFSKTRIFKMSLGQGTDNPIFEYCMDNNVIANGYGNGIDFSGVKTKQDIIKRLGSDNKYDFSVEAMNRFILWMKPGDIVLIADGTSSIVAIAQIEGDYEYRPDTDIIYNNFRKVRWLYKGNVPIRAIYNKNLSMQSIYAFFNENKFGTNEYNTNINTKYLNELISGKEFANTDKKYVLIIDEINRGNISKIFGELITLLEPTKRIEADEELVVTLPYSKESFGVPANLYIIGTMNTSDRSIASLDVALRRRFSFVAMRPENSLVKDIDGIRLNSIFSKINKKIELLLDEDHMIGHSFFMKCKSINDVRMVWFNEIIPLINEYFYGDWEKINLILGNDFVKLIPMDDMPEDLRSYCAGETYYRFASIQDNFNDADFVTKLNKLG